jgi:hypothetical protein
MTTASRPSVSPPALSRARFAVARARAYTAVEVLMAMTFAGIGSAAVIAMMKTTVHGDLDARKTDVANAIAHTWAERLRRDAMQWTLPNTQGVGNNFANAKYLNHADASWHQLSDYMGATPETQSYGFDILGRDLALGDIPHAEYCVLVHETWLVAPNLPVEPGLMRADIRVIWFRGVSQSSTAKPAAGGICDSSAYVGAYNANPDPNNILHSVYLTTTIKQNGQP